MIDCLVSHWLFYACMLAALVLSIIPIAGKFLNVLNTMVHESGHAIMALMSGGGVMNIKLSADASGAAQTKSKYWIGKVLTSLAGYPTSSITAWFFFWLIQQHKINYVFYVIVSLVLINLILWVRNTFGMIWLVAMGILNVAVYMYGNTNLHYYFSTFFAGVVLFQSIYTTFTLLFISFSQPSKAGDAKNLRDFTYIPAFVWAILMLIIVFFITYKIIYLLPCNQEFL